MKRKLRLFLQFIFALVGSALFGWVGYIVGGRVLYSIFTHFNISLAHGCISGVTETVLGGLFGISLGALLCTMLVGKILFEKNNYLFAILFSIITFAFNIFLLFNSGAQYIFRIFPSFFIYISGIILYLLIFILPSIVIMKGVHWENGEAVSGGKKNYSKVLLVGLTLLALIISGISFYFTEVRTEKIELINPVSPGLDEGAC